MTWLTVPVTSHRPLRLILVTHVDVGAARVEALLGVAVLALAFFAQLAIVRTPAGAVLWGLFAAASIAAWRATVRRGKGVELLEVIVEGAADGVFVKDLEGRYVLLNDAAAAAALRARRQVVAPSAKASAAAAVKSIAGSTVCHERTSST